MTVRTAARAATAHAWRVMKPALVVMILFGLLEVCALLYISPGSRWGEAVAWLVIVALFIRLLFTRFPHGREMTVVYLELARLIERRQNGQWLHVHDRGGHVFLRCRHQHIRSVIRIDMAKADLARVDQPGWVPVEEYGLVPVSNQVFRLTRSGRIGDDGIEVGARYGLTGRDTAKVIWLALTTGHGFGAVDDLRELVRQVREAQPFDSEA